MADYKYAYQGPTEGTARAVLLDVPISTKAAIEIANYLRGKRTTKAITLLELVLQKKQAIPYKRFTDGVGHRKGKNIAGGRYPEKASKEFIKLIKLAEANASQKGLDDEELIIKHIMAHQASKPFHYGRQRRRQMKRTHIEIVVEEIKEEETTKKKITKKKEQEEKKKKPESKKTESKKADDKKENKTKKTENKQTKNKEEKTITTAKEAKEEEKQKPKTKKTTQDSPSKNKEKPEEEKNK